MDADEALEKLSGHIEENRLAVLVGSGVSVNSDLPTWDQLLDQFVQFCAGIEEDLEVTEGVRRPKLLEEARREKKNYPLRVASVLRNHLVQLELETGANIQKLFSEWLLDLFYGKKFNENHRSIVATNYSQILTTNYDNLLENAARNENFRRLAARAYSFDDSEKVAAAVYERITSIIHIHGDRQNVALEDFVFTSEDYVRIRRAYPGFTLALQTIFVTNSILFVGYGGSDPHLEELLEDILYLWEYSASPKLPKYYILLRRDKAGRVLKNYKEKLRTTIIEIEDYEETPVFLGKLSTANPRTADAEL